MKTKIAIIGLGNIGRRHLQAVSRLANLDRILGCDVNQSSLDNTITFCRENNLPDIELDLTTNLEKVLKALTKETIVIVATTAFRRGEILKKILYCRPRAILVEKPLCQGIKEYQEVMRLSQKNRVPVYVNFSRHMYVFYQEIYQLVHKLQKKSFNAFFSGGIACNGIHLLELATWLLGSKTYKIVYSRKDEIYETKRKGFYDFSGELILKFDDGNLCFLKASKEKCPFSIGILCPEKEFKIFEDSKKIIHLNGSSEIKMDDIDIPYVSQLTDKVIDRLVNRKIPELPDIRQSFMAHKILFDYMKLHKLENLNIT